MNPDHLRLATRSENTQNWDPRGLPGRTSRFRGVYWHKRRKKWVAQVTVAGEQHYLGVFDDEEDAGRMASSYRAAHMPFSSDAAM